MNNYEPVAIINGTITLIEASAIFLLAYGFKLSTEHIGLITAAIVAAGNLARTYFTRKNVTPVENPRDSSGHNLVAAE